MRGSWSKWLWWPRAKGAKLSAKEPEARKYVLVKEHKGIGDPRALHWKACHPSTVRRFKAEMTCKSGHGLVLKLHSVSADGVVTPSVVCLRPGCNFHEFVRLEGWKIGPLD
jgi:hypothetical protein